MADDDFEVLLARQCSAILTSQTVMYEVLVLIEHAGEMEDDIDQFY